MRYPANTTSTTLITTANPRIDVILMGPVRHWSCNHKALYHDERDLVVTLTGTIMHKNEPKQAPMMPTRPLKTGIALIDDEYETPPMRQ